MDSKMVDDEDKRQDRKQAHIHQLPNRQARRKQAKRMGIFKRPGAWQFRNTGRRKNQSINGDQSDED